MAYNLTDRIKNAWNAFKSRDPTTYSNGYYGTTYRPDRRTSHISHDGSIIETVKNRIAVDISQVDIKHVRTDEEGNYKESIKSPLNEILTFSANIDQTGRAFIQDLAQSLFDEGVIAAVPIDTDVDPYSGSFDIYSIRVGKVVEWFPRSVRVRAFNEQTGQKEEIEVPKETTAIIENPFYSVMNAPNSTLQRLIRTLRNLDIVNEQNSSGKLDMIIQLPYSLKSPLKQQQAEGRRKQIESQLVNSKYGIAYIDAAERITQLNRPVENNLWKEAQDLTAMLFNQLGLSQSIFDGTADDATMNNYYNRTIEPILSAITEEMERKFLTRTARTQRQRIMYIRDPFKLVTMNELAGIAQTFTQNEIMSSNEIRAKMGLKPVDTQRANDLINKNINKVGEEEVLSQESAETEEINPEELKSQLKDLDSFDDQLNSLEVNVNGEQSLKHYASPYYDPVKAHKYYMEHRELKGRKSTANLNDEGKAAARYIKAQLDAEKKSVNEQHKAEATSKLQSISSQQKSETESYREGSQAGLKRLNNEQKSENESNRSATNARIEQYKEETQGKIDSLRAQLKSMSKSDKDEHREEINSMIAELRADNASMRNELRAKLKEMGVEVKEKYQGERESIKSDLKSSTAGIKDKYQGERTSVRENLKEQRAATKEEYDRKYEEELENIRNTKEFQGKSRKKRRSSSE